jgi:hypothetical protein
MAATRDAINGDLTFTLKHRGVVNYLDKKPGNGPLHAHKRAQQGDMVENVF